MTKPRDQISFDSIDHPRSAADRPGWRTTEFWLSSLALVLGAVLASGALPDGGTFAQIAGAVLAALSCLGYDAARARVKVAALETRQEDPPA